MAKNETQYWCDICGVSPRSPEFIDEFVLQEDTLHVCGTCYTKLDMLSDCLKGRTPDKPPALGVSWPNAHALLNDNYLMLTTGRTVRTHELEAEIAGLNAKPALQAEAVSQLRIIQSRDGNDIEGDHVDADQVLCDLLIELVCSDVVAEYNKIGKWYT